MKSARRVAAFGATLAFIGTVCAQEDHAGHAAPHDAHAPDAAASASMEQHPEIDHSPHDHAADARGEASRPSSGHVAPPPPGLAMHAMSAAEMIDVMGMDDRAWWASVAFDRFERVEGGAFSWSARASHGGDEDRIALRSEGERADGRVEHADVELLWSHAVAPFWDTQLGVRRDVGRGPDRRWAAFGVQGLAPYWFEVGATAYVGQQGRSALRAEIEYEWLLTQRLVLQPRLEINAYGKRDPATRTGAGLADAEVGLRLRYEMRREFAPYIGVERRQRFGATADYARADGHGGSETQWVAGVRFWF